MSTGSVVRPAFPLPSFAYDAAVNRAANTETVYVGQWTRH